MLWKPTLALNVVLCIALFAPLPVSAGATQAKCTCYLTNEGEKKDGADVSNAKACYLTKDTKKKWCTFDVDSLESSSHGRFSSYGDFLNLLKRSHADQEMTAAFFIDRFVTWYDKGNAVETLNGLNASPDEVLDKINNGIDNMKSTLHSCVGAFIEKDSTGSFAILQGNDFFGCGVHQSGWLTLTFDFDSFVVNYLLGPR